MKKGIKKIHITITIIATLLFLFASCKNYYVNKGIKNYLDEYGNIISKITFNANGGTGEMSSQALKNGTETYLNENTFTHSDSHYKFVGWNTQKDGLGIPFADGGLVTFTESKTLYAQWALDSAIYTITFDGNGGSVVNGDGATEYVQYVEKGYSAQLKPKTFENGDTTFIGWTTAKDGSGTAYQNNEVVESINSTQTLYAQWGYTVSFDTDGGTDVPSQLVIKGKTFSSNNLPSTPTKEGYAFESWYKEVELTNRWDFDTDTVASEITLYAKWIKTEYTITFDNEGEISEQKVDPLTPTPLTKNTKEVKGKLFIGWATVSDGTGDFYNDGQEVSLNTNLELYAQWRDAITVSFDATSGTGDMSNLIVPSGIESIISKNIFVHEDTNQRFIGWNTIADGTGDSYTDEGKITITADTTLYAQWDSDVVTITFNGNGGVVSGTELAVSMQDIKKNTDTLLQPNGFTLEDSTFSNWNTKADGSGDTYTNSQKVNIDVGIILYAQWKSKVIITYNQNYGSNLTQTQETNEGETTSLNKNLFERERYFFTGWNTGESGDGTGYTDEDEVRFSTDTTLYAQWITAPYSDSLARTIVSNGYNLKMVSEGSGSTIKWLYDGNEIALEYIGSSNISNGSDLSTYTIVNAKGADGNYLGTGDHILEGGSIRGVEGMNTLSIKGSLAIGSGSEGGIVLTKDNQLTIAGTLTGADNAIIVRSHTIKQNDVIATVTAGGNPIAKLNITDRYGSLPVDTKYENDKLIALGQLGLTPSDRVIWDDGGSFTIPEIVLGVEGTIFSLSVEDGYFTLGSATTIAGAELSMGIPINETTQEPDGYVTSLNKTTKYSYVQFFPTGETFPAENASSFVQSLTFTQNDPTKEISVKINLETVELSEVNNNVTYFNGSFYKVVSAEEKGWITGYNSAKDQSFNGLQGYLINITSDSENKFIYDKVLKDSYGAVRCWIGGTRLNAKSGYDAYRWIDSAKDEEEGNFYWAAGPEAGTIFYYGTTHEIGSEAHNEDNKKLFHTWAPNEPNSAYEGSENCAQYYANNVNNADNADYFWNDAGKAADLKYSIVEFTPYTTSYGSQVAEAKAAFAEQYYIKK